MSNRLRRANSIPFLLQRQRGRAGAAASRAERTAFIRPHFGDWRGELCLNCEMHEDAAVVKADSRPRLVTHVPEWQMLDRLSRGSGLRDQKDALTSTILARRNRGGRGAK